MQSLAISLPVGNHNLRSTSFISNDLQKVRNGVRNATSWWAEPQLCPSHTYGDVDLEVRKTILAGLVLALLAPFAKADQFNFNLSGCSGGCALPAGMVTLTQDKDGVSVDVTVTLTDPGSGFIDTGNGNSHTSFVFDIAGDPSITLSNLSAGFTYPADTTIDTPFGTFDYGIDCTTCGPGAKNKTPPPLTFTVTKAGGLSVSDFTFNSYTVNSTTYDVFFAADIYDGVTGNTGAVGAANPGPTVPEPQSIALLGSGLASLAFFRHRRRLS